MQAMNSARGRRRRRRIEKGTTWHEGFNREEEVQLVTAGGLVEGLAAGVIVIYVARVAATMAGVGAAGVADERVVTRATVRKDKICYIRWWLLLLTRSRWQRRKKK